jgi:hypothetical protein
MITQPPVAMLVTEDEARKIFFSPESRPSPLQMASLRKTHHLPALRFGSKILYWADELESHLKAMQRQKLLKLPLRVISQCG